MMRRRSGTVLRVAGMFAGIVAAARLLRMVWLKANADYFEGKVVLITGASRGIGRMMAQAFARRGAHVVLSARNEDELQQTAEICHAANPRIETHIIPADVTDATERQHLIDSAILRFGRVDVLVSNAGIRRGGALLGLAPEEIRQVIEVNLMAGIELSRLLLPAMIDQGGGHMVFVSSAAGRHTEPYFVPYGTSKHGLMGYAEGIRREFAKDGVHVMTVTPGYTATDMVTYIGPVLERMGFEMIPVERVVRRTLEGIVLRKAEVKVGWFETFGGYMSVLFPRLTDLYWRVLMPNNFPEAAAQQK